MESDHKDWIAFECERLVKPRVQQGPLPTKPALSTENKIDCVIPLHDKGDSRFSELQRQKALVARFHPLPAEQLPTLPLVEEQADQALRLATIRSV